MTMQTQNPDAAHSLFVLYETLPEETQQLFLQELLAKQSEKVETLALYLACKEAKEENEFLSDAEAQAFINSLPK
ncbi:MAG TPA: hypothetical protein DCZ48_03890 [Methylococcaceae bacterium]|nr:hypothetical protein [Methylococcaceae bacterium]